MLVCSTVSSGNPLHMRTSGHLEPPRTFLRFPHQGPDSQKSPSKCRWMASPCITRLMAQWLAASYLNTQCLCLPFPGYTFEAGFSAVVFCLSFCVETIVTKNVLASTRGALMWIIMLHAGFCLQALPGSFPALHFLTAFREAAISTSCAASHVYAFSSGYL